MSTEKLDDLYRKALIAVRLERTSASDLMKTHERGRRSHDMSAKDREILGALFHAFTKKIASKEETGWYGTRYTIQTDVGPLVVHYDVIGGNIYGKFEDPKAAQGRTIVDVNPHSGKWNYHSFKGDEPRSFFDEWKREIGHLRRETDRK